MTCRPQTYESLISAKLTGVTMIIFLFQAFISFRAFIFFVELIEIFVLCKYPRAHPVT